MSATQAISAEKFSAADLYVLVAWRRLAPQNRPGGDLLACMSTDGPRRIRK